MENTDGIKELEIKNGSSCKTWNIVEFAKLWMQFIKIRIFPIITSVFFTALQQNQQKLTFLLCFGVINVHAASLLCSLCVGVSQRAGAELRLLLISQRLSAAS